MAHYSLMMDCIHYVQDKVQGRCGGPTLQLNIRQCKYLAKELLKVSESLQGKTAYSNDLSIILLHLHATVKRAQLLVESCCCDNISSLLAAAMILGNSEEEVIAILLDLHQWSFVLDVTICASTGGSWSFQSQELLETGEESYQRLSKQQSKMQNAIREAARLDQEELLKILQSLGEVDQRDADYIRGLYLKSWLNCSDEDLQSVEELKAWTFLSDLGCGNYGMVRKVTWLGQEVALKMLNKIDRTEATILGQIQHPNIVRLFHYWEDLTPYPRSCIVMELMPTDLQRHIGNELRKQLGTLSSSSNQRVTGRMPFSLPVAIHTMLQVAQALRQLHEMRLVHRDLKTSNILVKPVSEEYLELHNEGYMEVKLADFGSSKAFANTSQTRDLTRNMGTTKYGAPEVFEKEKVERESNFSPKADVWSFGMTCSEILTGKAPFADDTSLATLHTRITKNGLRPSLPNDCPKYLRFCIESCWELRPQRRPSFSDLCRMLRHAKFLSLGLMDVESSKCWFAYQTSAGVMKSGLHSLLQQKDATSVGDIKTIINPSLQRQEDANMSRSRLNTMWRTLRGVQDNAISPLKVVPWHIFISYAATDEKFAFMLSKALEGNEKALKRNYKVFIDHLTKKNVLFPDEVLKQITISGVAIVVVTEEFFLSKSPMMELLKFVELWYKKNTPSKLRILPLFYTLTPGKVREKVSEGVWEKRWEKDSVEVYRRAVMTLCNINSIVYPYRDSRFDDRYIKYVLETVNRLYYEMRLRRS